MKGKIEMRITRKHVKAKVSTLNSMLGYGENPKYPTPGAIRLYSAYDAWTIHRVVNDAGGVSDLMGGMGTLRECARFLDGMIQALRIHEPI
jgi:hypothetical protein